MNSNLLKTVILITIIGHWAALIHQVCAQDNSKKTSIVKINAIAPLLIGSTEIGYEYIIPKNSSRSLEANLGIIGLGVNKSANLFPEDTSKVLRDSKGVYGSFGYKINFSNKSLSTSPANGFYIKPTLSVGGYKHNRGIATVIGTGTLFGFPAVFYGDVGHIKEKVSFVTFDTKIGYQFSIWQTVQIETFLGLGYGFDNKAAAFNIKDIENAKIGDVHYMPSSNNISTNNRFIGTVGINVGFAF